MKHTTAIQKQKAYVSPSFTPERRMTKLQEARTHAIMHGHKDEEGRIQHALSNLRQKALQQNKVPEGMSLTLAKDLGGARDPIFIMIKGRKLNHAQGWAAVLLREHNEGLTIHMGASGESIGRVDGGQSNGMEAMCDRRFNGRIAWSRAQEACQERVWRAAKSVICGTSIRKSCRLLPGRTETIVPLIQEQVSDALDAAAAYLGGPV